MPILGDLHVCPHEGNLKQINKELFGNGNDGVVKEVTKLKVKFVNIEDDIKKLATSYSALAKSEIEKDAIEQAKIDLEKKKLEERKKRSSIINRLGTIFGIMFGAATLLYIILDHIGNH